MVNTGNSGNARIYHCWWSTQGSSINIPMLPSTIISINQGQLKLFLIKRVDFTSLQYHSQPFPVGRSTVFMQVNNQPSELSCLLEIILQNIIISFLLFTTTIQPSITIAGDSLIYIRCQFSASFPWTCHYVSHLNTLKWDTKSSKFDNTTSLM